MANYLPRHSFNPNHPGDNNIRALSKGASHTVQHIQGAMDNTPAHPQPTQTPAANEAEEAMGSRVWRQQPLNHSRINFNPAHTCAACKVTCANNYALEKHAAKERHKAFLCTCNIKFVRLATLNRHIAAQSGPKHHCTYCDGNKSFAREDKLIDHLRASHKFGENAIAQFRRRTRASPQGNGNTSFKVATTGTALPGSISGGYEAALGVVVGQAGYSAGPAGMVDGDLADFLMPSAAELQPFGFVQDYPLFDSTEDFMDFDFSGVDLAGVDPAGVNGDLYMLGMETHP